MRLDIFSISVIYCLHIIAMLAQTRQRQQQLLLPSVDGMDVTRKMWAASVASGLSTVAMSPLDVVKVRAISQPVVEFASSACPQAFENQLSADGKPPTHRRGCRHRLSPTHLTHARPGRSSVPLPTLKASARCGEALLWAYACMSLS